MDGDLLALSFTGPVPGRPHTASLVAAGVVLTGDPEAGFGVFRQFTDDDTIL